MSKRVTLSWPLVVACFLVGFIPAMVMYPQTPGLNFLCALLGTVAVFALFKLLDALVPRR